MKRRLMKIYDQMTMPEDCSRRIQQSLQQAMEKKEAGRNVRQIPPSYRRSGGWISAVGGVCLLLCLLGSGVLLWKRETSLHPPVEESAVFSAVPGDYSLVTDIPGEAVEAFAAEIRRNVLDGDWEAFSEKVNYPIAILDQKIGNDGGLVGLTIRNKVKDAFVVQLRKESCSQMFCNWQGICMAEGRIWINEVDGELKITAINDMFGDLVDIADYEFRELESGCLAVTSYTGHAEVLTLVTEYDRKDVVQIGTGHPVMQNGDTVQTITVPESVTHVADRAFADCDGLTSVFFRGDAPTAGVDVFSGSENVTVYYPEDSSGWTNLWCGRPALPYSRLYVSLGTVQISTKNQEEANRLYDSILRGTQKIEFPEWNTQYTIAQYCDRRSSETGKQITCTQFTLVDMDRDGVKELILRIRPEGEPLDDYLILRYQKDGDISMVYCYAELRQMISGLKKDGAFFWEKDNARWVSSLKALSEDGGGGLSVMEAAQKSPVSWHSLSIVDPAWVLDSYLVIAEEARGEMQGAQFFYFEQLITGKMDGNWEKLQEHLQRNGFRCEEENGSVFVYDPASPGCVMFGTLDEALRLESLGYYICKGTGERMAEVRNLRSGAPEYRVEMNRIWEQETLGKPVSTPEEILQYFRD